MKSSFPKDGPYHKLSTEGKAAKDCRKGLQTVVQHGQYKERLIKEERAIQPEVNLARTIHPIIDGHNSYLSIFRKDDHTPPTTYKFTLDAIQDETPFDPKCERDTMYPAHKRRETGSHAKYAVTSSQQIGRLPPLEDFNSPFGRSRLEFN